MQSRPHPLVRLVDELLWMVRRDGIEVSSAQAIDVARAIAAVGLDSERMVREAIAAVVVTHPRDRRRFDQAFDAFFHAPEHRRRGTLWERLRARGIGDEEVESLRVLLERLASTEPSLGTLLEAGAHLDRLLALSGMSRAVDAHSGLQLGFRTHALLGRLGVGRARQVVAQLRAALVASLGERGEAVARALSLELDAIEGDVRAFVRRLYEERVADRERAPRRLENAPFTSLSDAEIEEVRRAVRSFAERLRGGARVRQRHARRGRIDPHRTLRRAMRSGGVPFSLGYRRRRRDRPKVLLLCDVSDSVRAAACFLLEFTYAAQELFERARSFVFVSELGETTDLFEREPVRSAISRAWGGGVVSSGENSNYGRMLRSFEKRYLPQVDRRTTVVILGDGRTNRHDPGAEVLDRVRQRARALVWLCPEPRGRWLEGDSAMPQYAPKCTSVLEVGSAAELEVAARNLVARG